MLLGKVAEKTLLYGVGQFEKEPEKMNMIFYVSHSVQLTRVWARICYHCTEKTYGKPQRVCVEISMCRFCGSKENYYTVNV